MSGGYFELLDWLLARDKKVFCDLKFFDIPATVGSAVRQLKDRGATFRHRSRQPVDHGGGRRRTRATRSKVLGVTVLTSLDRGDLDDLGFDCDLEALVVVAGAQRHWRPAATASFLPASKCRNCASTLTTKLLVISPGIRPVDNKPAGDQKRVVTVETAFANGADYIVVGRPIRDAESPRAAAEAMQASIAAQVGDAR